MIFKSFTFMFMSFNTLTFFMFFSLWVGAAFTPTQAFAHKAIGWHWYNELPFMKEKNNKNKEDNKDKENTKNTEEKIEGKESAELDDRNTAEAELTRLRKIVQEAKAKAILYPTEPNVRDYLALQNHVAEKAALFSRMWQKVLLDYPELDYRVSNPTQNGVQAIVYDKKRKKEVEAIKFFRERYGLFFFYRGNNPIDQELARVVDIFTKENNVSLKPISIDGKVLEIFGNYVDSANTANFSGFSDLTISATSSVVSAGGADGIDHGQAKKLGIEYFPALILVDPKSKKIKPLNYGFISVTELRTRFLQIATDFQDGV